MNRGALAEQALQLSTGTETKMQTIFSLEAAGASLSREEPGRQTHIRAVDVNAELQSKMSTEASVLLDRQSWRGSVEPVRSFLTLPTTKALQIRYRPH